MILIAKKCALFILRVVLAAVWPHKPEPVEGRGTFVPAAPYTSDTYKSLQTYGEDYRSGRTSRKRSFPERVGSYPYRRRCNIKSSIGINSDKEEAPPE